MEHHIGKLNYNLSHAEIFNEDNATIQQMEQDMEKIWFQLGSSWNIEER